VFPRQVTDGKRRDPLHGPGTATTAGLAVLVAIVREMKKARVQTPGSITSYQRRRRRADLAGEGNVQRDVKDQIDRCADRRTVPRH
jgi:hypothetical protein